MNILWKKVQYKCGSLCIYIYAFSRCFYPKRLTVHSSYTFFVSMCVPWESNPQPLHYLRNALTTKPQEHLVESFFFFFLLKSKVWRTINVKMEMYRVSLYQNIYCLSATNIIFPKYGRPYIIQSQRYGDLNVSPCPDCWILSIFSGKIKWFAGMETLEKKLEKCFYPFLNGI